LKNLQPILDPALVRDDYPQWASASSALYPGFLQFSRYSEPNVVAFQTGVPDQNGVSQGALPEQVQLVLTRSKINRRQLSCCHLAIGSHGKGGNDEGAPHNARAAFAPRCFPKSGHQGPSHIFIRLRRARVQASPLPVPCRAILPVPLLRSACKRDKPQPLGDSKRE